MSRCLGIPTHLYECFLNGIGIPEFPISARARDGNGPCDNCNSRRYIFEDQTATTSFSNLGVFAFRKRGVAGDSSNEIDAAYPRFQGVVAL